MFEKLIIILKDETPANVLEDIIQKIKAQGNNISK
jgi:hypothetical protein